MDAMFMKAMNSKTSDPGSLLLNIFQNKKKNDKWSHKYVALLNLRIYYTWKNIKKWCEYNKFEY